MAMRGASLHHLTLWRRTSNTVFSWAKELLKATGSLLAHRLRKEFWDRRLGLHSCIWPVKADYACGTFCSTIFLALAPPQQAAWVEVILYVMNQGDPKTRQRKAKTKTKDWLTQSTRAKHLAQRRIGHRRPLLALGCSWNKCFLASEHTTEAHFIDPSASSTQSENACPPSHSRIMVMSYHWQVGLPLCSSTCGLPLIHRLSIPGPFPFHQLWKSLCSFQPWWVR